MEVVNFKDMAKFLQTQMDDPPEIAIVETYQLNRGPGFKHYEQANSTLVTVQVIGMIRMWAYLIGTKIVIQNRDKKTVGYKYWGKKPLPKSNRLNHAYDATAHGIYYLQHVAKVRAPDLG